MSSEILLIVAFLFALLSAYISTRHYLNLRSIETRLLRNVRYNGYQILGQQVIVLSAIVVVGILGGFDLYEFGVSRTIRPLTAFVFGFVIYFAVLFLIEVSAYGFGLRTRLHDASFEAMRHIWPRDPQQKLLAFVAVCLINPFTEEIIFRGVLVHFFGGYLDSMLAAVLIGFALSIAAHMYQGIWVIPFQMIFHGTAILLLISPFGLVACFGLHMAGDLVPVVLLRRSMIAWRERRREERRISVR
jgi:membrane protease YdiL (CAAX protease family)